MVFPGLWFLNGSARRPGDGTVGGVLDGARRLALRVEGTDHLLNHFHDVLAVVVGRDHQLFQIVQELVLVELDRVADVDQVVVGLLKALFRHELLLIELLAGAQARVLDLDVHVRLEAGELDQVPRQGVDLDGAAHVQHEDLAALGVDPRHHHQTHCLGDSHEVADDVRVGDGHRTALFDLLLEDRDHRAVAAQYVAEAHGHELGFDVLEHLAGAVLVGVFRAVVGEQLGNLPGLARLDLHVEGLDDHLTQTLGRAHDVGGIDRLVRGDQHESLAAVHHGRVGRLEGADGVVLDGLAGAVLHQRYMLVGRRVIDHLGTVGLEHVEHPAAVPNGADEGLQVQVGILLPQLQLDGVGVVFVDVEYDQLLRIVRRDLSAELRADGPAAAGHQDRLAVDEFKDIRHVRPDGLAAQQVLHGHVLHGADGNLPHHELVQSRQLLQLAARLVADGQDVPLLLGGGAGDRQVDLVDIVFFYAGKDVVPAADDRNARHAAMPLVGVVVDDADHLVADLAGLCHVPEDHLGCVPRADQHDALRLWIHGLMPVLEYLYESESETHDDQQCELEDRSHQIVGNGHAFQQRRDQRRVGHGGDHGADEAAHQLGVAGVPPHAVVHACEEKDQDGARRAGEYELAVGLYVLLRDGAEHAVKPQKQRQEIGAAYRREVIDGQDHRYHLPVFQASSPAVDAIQFASVFRFLSQRSSILFCWYRSAVTVNPRRFRLGMAPPCTGLSGVKAALRR